MSNSLRIIGALFVSSCLLVVPATAADILVPTDHSTIQAAIDAAVDGDRVLVGPGSYDESLVLDAQMGIRNITVESVAGPAMTTIDGGNRDVPVFQVIGGASAATLITGFTITRGGDPVGPRPLRGGGISCLESTPTIVGNVITDNSCVLDGGGIYISVTVATASTGEVRDNTISGNRGNAGAGALVTMDLGSPPVIAENVITGNTGCTGSGVRLFLVGTAGILVDDNLITGNSADETGGGLEVLLDGVTSISTFSNNTFVSNSTLGSGGAAYIVPKANSELVFTNCLFDANVAALGGGVGLCENVTCTAAGPVFDQCTFANNIATDGGAGAIHGDNGASTPSATVNNCIVWGNTGLQLGAATFLGPGMLVINDLIATVTFSNVEGQGSTVFAGSGNIDANPQFVPGPLGDFYLSQLAAGEPLQSPSVDAGDPMAALQGGTTRTDELADSGVTDMGFHYPAPPPPATVFTRGDCNDDGANNIADAVYLLGFLFPIGAQNVLNCVDACDANDDGGLNIADVVTALGVLFPQGPPTSLPEPVLCGVDPTPSALDCASYGHCP